MLIERARAHARASQAQHHRPAIVAGRREELALETLHPHRAFAPCFARALGRKSADRARQLAHQGFVRARHQRDDRVVLDSHRRAQLLGQEMPQVDRQAAAELQALGLQRRRLRLDWDAARRTRERPRSAEYRQGLQTLQRRRRAARKSRGVGASMNQGTVSHSFNLPVLRVRSAFHARGRAAGHRQGPSENISNLELKPRLDGMEIDSGSGELRAIAVAPRQQRQPRRPAASTSGLRDRRAPIQTCAMRTGSFHQPTSPLSIRDARPPAPPTTQSKQRLDGYCARRLRAVKSPNLAFAIRATFSGLRTICKDGILISARTVVGQQRAID